MYGQMSEMGLGLYLLAQDMNLSDTAFTSVGVGTCVCVRGGEREILANASSVRLGYGDTQYKTQIACGNSHLACK